MSDRVEWGRRVGEKSGGEEWGRRVGEKSGGEEWENKLLFSSFPNFEKLHILTHAV